MLDLLQGALVIFVCLHISQFGVAEVCAGGSIAAGGGLVSSAARDASFVELDAPSDTSMNI